MRSNKKCNSESVGTTLDDLHHDTFCSHLVKPYSEPIMIVPDTLLDERFKSSPLVINDPHIRFYAGVCITIDNEKVGSLCIVDTVPRYDFDRSKSMILKDLADMIAQVMITRKKRSVCVQNDVIWLQQCVLNILSTPLRSLTDQVSAVQTFIDSIKVLRAESKENVTINEEFLQTVIHLTKEVPRLEILIDQCVRVVLRLVDVGKSDESCSVPMLDASLNSWMKDLKSALTRSSMESFKIVRNIPAWLDNMKTHPDILTLALSVLLSNLKNHSSIDFLGVTYNQHKTTMAYLEDVLRDACQTEVCSLSTKSSASSLTRNMFPQENDREHTTYDMMVKSEGSLVLEVHFNDSFPIEGPSDSSKGIRISAACIEGLDIHAMRSLLGWVSGKLIKSSSVVKGRGSKVYLIEIPCTFKGPCYNNTYKLPTRVSFISSLNVSSHHSKVLASHFNELRASEPLVCASVNIHPSVMDSSMLVKPSDDNSDPGVKKSPKSKLNTALSVIIAIWKMFKPRKSFKTKVGVEPSLSFKSHDILTLRD